MPKEVINLQKFLVKPQTEFVSTSIQPLDNILGGGICPGSMYSFWGEPGCGKTTIASQIMKSFLKEGKTVVFIDVEKSMNDQQKESFGLTKYPDNFIHLVCDNYLELQEISEGLLELKPDLVVLDSETEVQPSASKDQKVTDVLPGLKARQSSFLLNKMKSSFYHAGIASIILFHARANIQMTGFSNGPALKQAGGYAAVHIPDVILHLIPHQRVMDGDVKVGVELEMVCEKNKFTAPFRPERKKLIYGKGISRRYDVIDSCLASKLITSSGAGFFKLPWGDTIRGTKALYNLDTESILKLEQMLSNA